MPSRGRRPHFNPRSPHGERRCRERSLSQERNFNPRSPHGERPISDTTTMGSVLRFQSTLPARGATRSDGKGITTFKISIHAPRTGSDYRQFGRLGNADNFNPRSPHGERPPTNALIAALPLFQSTLPARGATLSSAFSRIMLTHFNPRSPHGERHTARA